MSLRNYARTFAIVTALGACTGSPSEGDDAAECFTGKCDGFGGAEVLAPLSTVTRNPDSFPVSWAHLAPNKILFLSQNSAGIFVTDGTPDGTKLVRDLDPLLGSGYYTPKLAVLGGVAYWKLGTAIWRSDGTPTGTSILADYAPAQDYTVGEPVVFGGELVYSAAGKLHVSDGTVAGTRVLAQMSGYSFEEMGGKLYFACDYSAAVGRELCVTDKQTVTLVKEIVPGIQGGSPRFIGQLNGKALFAAQIDFKWNLWVTDGTAAGTEQLLAASTNGDAVDEDERAVVYKGNLYVGCYTSATGFELLKTDGTKAGTSIIELAPGSAYISPGDLTVFNDKLVFSATTQAAGTELWTSDGTAAGTSMLVDLAPGVFSGVGYPRLVPFGDKLLFTAESEYQQELFETDGTAAGTKKIVDVQPAGLRGVSGMSLHNAFVMGDKLLFAANDGHGVEPFVTDGTQAGTMMLADAAPTQSDAYRRDAKTFGNATYVAVEDSEGTHIWRSNGLPEGTAKYTDLERQSGVQFTAAGSTLYFTGYDTLWKTNGAGAPTKVKDLNGPARELTSLGNTIAFISTTANQGYGLFLSDGTAANTVETGAVNGEYLAAASGRLWLKGLMGGNGNELWTSDGTVAGTKAVADLHAGFNSSDPRGFVGLGGKTLFTAKDSSGFELWITDGTAANTKRLKDIFPGTTGSGPSYLTPFKTTVLFWATSAANAGADLWSTDGTEAGTVRVKQFGAGFSNYSKLTVWGDHAFFSARDASGTELWRTDGTEAGTVRVADIYEGAMSSNPTDLVLATPDGPLYFVAEEPVGGREPWRLATPTGTPARLADVAPGPRSSKPSHLQTRGPALLFIAEGEAGPTLFRLGDAPDTVAPTIECPQSITIDADDAAGAAVTFALPDASDNDGEATVTTSPASGDVFPVGTTTVTATATDTASNTASCTFDVTVSYAGGGSGSGSGGGGGGGGGGGTGGGGEEPGVDEGGGGCSTTGSGSIGSLLVLLACLARRRRYSAR